MKATINVEKEDIMECDMCSTTDCVIGRSIPKSLPLCSESWVGMRDATLCDTGDKYYVVRFPKKIIRYIRHMCYFPEWTRWFRRPFSFEWEVPDCFVAKEPNRPKLQLQEEVKSLTKTFGVAPMDHHTGEKLCVK